MVDCRYRPQRLAATEPDACVRDCAEPSARSDTISWDIVETKSCFETLPLPDGSSAEKIVSEPCFWKWMKRL
jgi:hypothetical protein